MYAVPFDITHYSREEIKVNRFGTKVRFVARKSEGGKFNIKNVERNYAEITKAIPIAGMASEDHYFIMSCVSVLLLLKVISAVPLSQETV